MQTEIEAKWLNIDLEEFRQRLKKAEATLMHPERLMIRKNYDYPDKRLDAIGGWVRVRDEGDRITLSYKQLDDRTLHGTKEVSVTVQDFDSTCAFLLAIGLIETNHQETKRESWRLGDVQIELDTWPWIPSFVEIEASNEDTLRQSAVTLGLDLDLALHGSVETAYQAVYDVTEAEVDGWQLIEFTDVPTWLEEKRYL